MMFEYLFFFERQNGEYIAVETSDIKIVKKLYDEYEKKAPNDIVTFGWTKNDDTLSTQLIKKKAKMVNINDV